MSENDENINKLLDELSKFTAKLIKLEYCFKNQDDLINDKLNGYDASICYWSLNQTWTSTR